MEEEKREEQGNEKEVQQESSYEFLKETIKRKPVDKKKLVKQIGGLAGAGAIFGLTAAVVFSLTVPTLEKQQQEKEADSRVQFHSQTEEEQDGQEQGSREEQEAERISAEKALGAESRQQTEEQQEIVMELTPQMYEKFYTDIFAAADRAKHSMVTVIGSQNDRDWFETPYESQISGLLVAESGQDFYVLTEYRIVENVDRIQVVFYDGTVTDARFLKADPNTALAVLKIPKSEISASVRDELILAPLGEAYQVKQGEPVLAIGSPMGYSDSVGYGIVTSTSGRVSKIDAEYEILTTDIAGTSKGSGVILNLDGEIVGIISQNFAREDTENRVTGLMVSEIRELIEILSDEEQHLLYMGITGQDITAEVSEKKGIPVGVFVEKVEVDSPAMQVGIQNGDVIVEINGEKIKSVRNYQQKLKSCRPGETIKVKAMRQGTEAYIEVAFDVTIQAR